MRWRAGISRDLDYYLCRAKAERRLADKAADEVVAAIHQRLAEMWELTALSEQAIERGGLGNLAEI